MKKNTTSWAVLLTVLLLFFCGSTVKAHEWQQVFWDYQITETNYEVTFLFDASYAVPARRNDPNDLQPPKKWLEKRTPAQHATMREETQLYLNSVLSFYHQNEQEQIPLKIDYRFPDWNTEPPAFPDQLDGGAYMTVKFSVPLPKNGDLVLRTASEQTPNIMFQVGEAEGKKHYHTLTPGGSYTFFTQHSTQATAGDFPTRSESLLSYLKLGFLHVLPFGLDHIFFIVALCLIPTNLRSLGLQSLIFTVAHCITYGLLATQIIILNAELKWWVEFVIVLSILLLAVENLCDKKINTRRMVLIFVFGLVHGMGFGSEFAFAVPERDAAFFAALIATNIGIELAQLVLIGVSFFLLYKVIKQEKIRARSCLIVSWLFILFSSSLLVQRVFF